MVEQGCDAWLEFGEAHVWPEFGEAQTKTLLGLFFYSSLSASVGKRKWIVVAKRNSVLPSPYLPRNGIDQHLALRGRVLAARGLPGSQLLGAQDAIPAEESLVRIALGISDTRDPDGLENARISELIGNDGAIEVIRPKLVVGLEAADVMRGGGIDPCPKLLELRGELLPDRNSDERALLVMMVGGTELGGRPSVGVGHRPRQYYLTKVL